VGVLGVQQCLGLPPDAVAVSVELHRSDAVDGFAAAGFADAVVAAGGFEFAVRHQLAQHLDGNAGVGVALGVAVPVGAKYHLGIVVIDLRNRGVRDILIACCDGLTGLPDAIRSIYPDTVVQTRVVHMIRNAMRFVSYKDRKKVASSMRAIYNAPTVDGAELALKEFDQQFGQQYPGAVDVGRNAWPEFVPFLDYPIELPKIVYTTNAIESINVQLRKITKNRGPFPDKDAAMNLIYHGLRNISSERGGYSGTGTPN
jgi:transposase-like protein